MDKIISTGKYKSGWVCFAAMLMTFIPVFFIQYSLLKYTDGVFMYPLDDTFIHMEIAKNLAFNNTWGIHAGEFGSASSSVLYTIILSIAFKLAGPHVMVPFIINCIAGILLILTVQRWLIRNNVSYRAQLLVFFLIAFLAPLPILIISGMEHTLQCLFSFLFIFGFADWLKANVDKEKTKWNMPWNVIIYGILVSTIRYEGIFLVIIACCILLFYRKLWESVLLGFISLLPLVLFGLYSMAKGSFFVPNSVLVKSDGAQLSLSSLPQFFSNVLIEKLTLSKTITSLATQRLLLLLPLGFILFRKNLDRKVSYGWILIILFIATIFHLSLATTGWFYRYEAYLVFCSVIILFFLTYKHGREFIASNNLLIRGLAVALCFFLLFPLLLRSTAAFSKAKQACINIFDQQYQMGQFLSQHYTKETIAANDIGAVTFFTQGKIIDLWGLASIEIARSRKNNYWNNNFLDSLSRQKNTKLAVVYDSWFHNSLDQYWKKIATWKIQNNVICGDDIVSFYSIDSTGAQQLKNNLQRYELQLPKSVEVKYY